MKVGLENPQKRTETRGRVTERNFIPSRDGSVKRTETRQGRKNSRTPQLLRNDGVLLSGLQCNALAFLEPQVHPYLKGIFFPKLLPLVKKLTKSVCSQTTVTALYYKCIHLRHTCTLTYSRSTMQQVTFAVSILNAWGTIDKLVTQGLQPLASKAIYASVTEPIDISFISRSCSVCEF